MGIVLENTVLVPCAPSDFYTFCVEGRHHYNIPGYRSLAPDFVDCVQGKSWAETVETDTESIRYSYTLYPIADSTRVTIGVEIEPKGVSSFMARLKAAGYRKRETARLAAIKKNLEKNLVRNVIREVERENSRKVFPMRFGEESG
ncbi:hypothetical protein [Arthrobacter rhizosphaerae]|uniref:hypothetical protein n=1 Tax=Arthrobacter rhizosphaerae TaxID=2855490 RepID=UPI001FF212AD|nr:hypothetical protein [Arthrobacter rhizosphaerae]